MPKVRLPHGCKKINNEKYSKRPSPPYHANECPDAILNGNDGNQYFSKMDKNGLYKWKKIKKVADTKNANEYYKQFNKNVKKYNIKEVLSKFKKMEKEFKKHDIYLFKIGWKNIYNFIDYAWDVAENKAKKNTSFIFYTEFRSYWAEVNGQFNLHHSILKKDKNYIITTFKKYFDDKHFEWKNYSPKNTIDIFLNLL